jgi:hypothetical protein
VSDPLAELRERIDAAQAATERLASEVRDVPRAAGEARGEIGALAAFVQAAGALLPDDLLASVRDLVRGLLLLVRALLDRWIDALEGPPPAAPPERDIPIG